MADLINYKELWQQMQSLTQEETEVRNEVVKFQLVPLLIKEDSDQLSAFGQQ